VEPSVSSPRPNWGHHNLMNVRGYSTCEEDDKLFGTMGNILQWGIFLLKCCDNGSVSKAVLLTLPNYLMIRFIIIDLHIFHNTICNIFLNLRYE
jgi:hypothetical protein